MRFYIENCSTSNKCTKSLKGTKEASSSYIVNSDTKLKEKILAKKKIKRNGNSNGKIAFHSKAYT